MADDLSFGIKSLRAKNEIQELQNDLKESEEHLRSTVENAETFAIYRIEVDEKSEFGGRVVFVSPSLRNLMGIEDINNFQLWFKNIIPDDKSRVIEANMRSAQTGERFDQVMRIYNPIKKELRWIHAISTSIKDETGVPKFFNGIITDITELKKAEREVEFQKARLEQLFKNSPVGLVLLDRDDRIIEVNEGFEEIFGFTTAEIKGKILNELIIPQAFQNQAKELSMKTQQGDVVSAETVRKRKDGSLVFVRIYGVPIIVDDNRIGIYGMYVDISERKKFEEKIIKEKLKAEEANRLKSGFLSAMSHEIRTPLNVILGYSGVLKDLYIDKISKEEKSYFNSIENACMRLMTTISQILDISRLEANEFPIEIEKLSLTSAVNSAIDLLKIKTNEKKLDLFLVAPMNEIYVEADKYCLDNALINIINNAIKYSDKGKIEIILSTADKKAICVVKDEGIGMSEEYQQHLFESFSQEDVGMKRRYEGTGLGLALTKRYIELMNGRIEIESEKGVGTKVKILLPLVK